MGDTLEGGNEGAMENSQRLKYRSCWREKHWPWPRRNLETSREAKKNGTLAPLAPRFPRFDAASPLLVQLTSHNSCKQTLSVETCMWHMDDRHVNEDSGTGGGVKLLLHAR